MPQMSIVEAVRDALTFEMARDERVMILGEDVGGSGGVFRATDGLQARFGKARVVDAPLGESAIIGSAIGLAAAGMVPVAEIQFVGFTHNAFNQIVEQLARWRYRSWGSLSAPVTVRAPFGGGVRAPEMHSDGFEAHFAHAPGLKVVAPSNAADARGLLLGAIRDPDPVLFLEPLRGYRLSRGEVPEGDVVEPIGQARVVREGTDVTVIAWSLAVDVARQAAETAAAEGLSVEVIDVRTLVPLDEATLRASVRKTGRAVVVQEASQTGGFAAEVITTLQEDADTFFSLKAPIARVCGVDTPYPVQMLEEGYLLNGARTLAAIRRVTQE
ncbi:MAG: alpha-ketoacid dehydrogenase subunit beta [Acidobacteria bacterium]|nr:alpha-ketoacid dehydrogenase subunit beta [Acidobacteriota bacterium]